MSNLQNEEIMAMRNTASILRKRIALEASSAKKEQLKRTVKELDEMIVQKLGETSDFVDIRIEEDIY